jgi:hypothetical protein
MKEEDEVVTSPLSQNLELAGKSLKITIYRGIYGDDGWFFEVADSDGISDVSSDMYPTAEAAFDAAMTTLHGGLSSL